jgi:OOP family OmpA-OmpF porin
MKKLIVALAATIAAAGAAQAQVTPMDAKAYSPRPYVGIAVSGADNQATDNWRASPKIFGGYDIDQNWGVELGYTHHGSEDYDTRGNNGVPVRGQVKGSSSYVAAKYTVPVNERVSAYAKLGAAHSVRKNEVNGVGSFNERDTGVYGGLGVQYALNQNVSVVGEYERYGKDKATGAKADALSVGLKYGF